MNISNHDLSVCMRPLLLNEIGSKTNHTGVPHRKHSVQYTGELFIFYSM